MKLSNTVFFILIVFLFCSCSRGTSEVSPSFHGDGLAAQSKSIGIWGPYELTINSVEMTAELVSKRNPMLGESFLIEGISYFVTSPCSDCLKMVKIGLTPDGYIELGFSLKHPFQPGNPGKPPSGKNRLDLDIFDPALVIVPLEKIPTEFVLTSTSIYDSVCPFADGYTKEIYALTGDPAVCPYFLVVDNDDSGTDTFNEFPMGAEETFSTYFDLSSELRFELYLTFGYGKSVDNMFMRLNPFYFNPEFNRKSAWKVEAIPPELGDTWVSDDSSTLKKVTVKVWDWQHGNTSIVNPPVNPTDIAFSSDVLSVSVEIPGMVDTLSTQNTPVDGTGSNPQDPLIYEFMIANENLLPEGEYASLVKVLDERIPPSEALPGLTDTLAHSPDGVTLTWNEIPEFATYQTFTATVISIPCEPMDEVAKGQRSAIQSQQLHIFRTKTDFENFWVTHDSFNPPPTIDFDTKMAIVVFIGARSSSGFFVTTDCVKLFPNLVDITFTEHIPGPG